MPLTEARPGFDPKIIEQIEEDLKKKKMPKSPVEESSTKMTKPSNLPELGHSLVGKMEKINPDDKPNFQFLKSVKDLKRGDVYFDKVSYMLSGMNDQDIELYQISGNLLGVIIDNRLNAIFPKKDFNQCRKMLIGHLNPKENSISLNQRSTEMVDLSKTSLSELLNQKRITHEQYNSIIQFQEKGIEESRKKMIEELEKRAKIDPSPLLKEEINKFRKLLIDNPDKTNPGIKDFLDSLPNLDKLRSNILLKMERVGIIQLKEINNRNVPIIDLNKISRTNLSDVIYRSGAGGNEKNYLFSSEYYGNGNIIKTLHYLFYDGVVSKDDYDKALEDESEIKPKPLVYYPENIDQALDPEKIRRGDFYYGFWTLAKGSKYQEMFDNIDAKEAALACIIFHPKYANGRINEKGELVIYNKKTKKYQPFSATHIVSEYKTSLGTGSININLNSGIKFFEKHCQNLFKRGLLKPENFKINQPQTQKEYRSTRSVSFGFTMIDKVRYYIKKDKWLDDNALSTKLTDKLGCVYDKNTGDILYTFQLKNASELKNNPEYLTTQKSDGVESIILTKEQTAAQKYDPKSFRVKRADETMEEFQKRINAVDDFKYELKISQDLLKLPNKINWLEFPRQFQQQIIQSVKTIEAQTGYPSIISFVHKFGLNGLKTLSSSEYGNHFGTKIYELGSKLLPELASQIFSEYTRIEESARSFSDKLKNGFLSGKLGNEVYEAFLRRTTDILSVAHKVALTGKAECKFYNGVDLKVENINEVIDALTKYRRQLELMSDFVDPKNANHYQFEYLPYDSDISKDPVIYHFKVTNIKTPEAKPYHFMLQTRSNGVQFAQRDALREYDGEARINFLWVENPQNPDDVSELITNPERNKALSIRLDREGKERAGTNLSLNDPTKLNGAVSLDMGSISDHGKIAAIGNYLTQFDETYQKPKENQEIEFMHNWKSFSPEFGQADNFAQIAEQFQKKIRELYNIPSQTREQEELMAA